MKYGTLEDCLRLRQLTCCGMADAAKSLEEAQGDFNKAIEIAKRKVRNGGICIHRLLE